MVRIPGGGYRPLYVTPDARQVHVATFALDRLPVTRGDFARFTRTNPRWARGTIRSLFAERTYLADWPSDSGAGSGTDLERPVTNVSWFAAKAYCAAQDKRLPTVDEWEYVAAASERVRDARDDPSFRARLLALYASRTPGLPPRVGTTFANVYGVRDLHGVLWEWTFDFNSTVVGNDSRASGSGQDARDHHLFCASAAIGTTRSDDYPAFLRYAVRSGLTARTTIGGLGFRCAADSPS